MAVHAQELDLIDVAVMLTYERAGTEPRFRHTKLREVAFPGEELKTELNEAVSVADGRPTTTIVLERETLDGRKMDLHSPPDRPANMLPENLTPEDKLSSLKPEQLETIFHQARGHDGCYKSVALLQHFFDLFPPETLLRIHHGPRQRDERMERGLMYTTQILRRTIIEHTLLKPRQATIISVLPEDMTYVSGESETMKHAVIGFAYPDTDQCQSVLDLSSMQFGDVGRGPGAKGKALFALDLTSPGQDEYHSRIMSVSEGTDGSEPKMSTRIDPCPDDDWLKAVAKKVKERWEKRDTERWCRHCGGPAKITMKCTYCKKVWYCKEEHALMDWGFHKYVCEWFKEFG